MVDQAGTPACGNGLGDSMAFPWGRDPSLSDGFSSLVRCQGCHQAISAGLTLSCRDRSHSAGLRFVRVTQATVDASYLAHEAPAGGVVEIKQLLQRPMKVVCDVRDLLVELVWRVRQNPPGAPPATSTAKSCLHEGQVTLARVWPSVLIRR